MNNISSKTIQVFAIGLLSVVLMAGFASKSNAADAPEKSVDASEMKKSGTLTFKGRSYNLIVGGTWGEGVLTYKGKTYKFKAKSVGAGYAVGVKDTNVTGVVYDLKNLNDFSGSYYGVKAAGTAFVGAGAANVQNSNGVVLSMKSTSAGVAVDVGAGLSRIVVELVK